MNEIEEIRARSFSNPVYPILDVEVVTDTKSRFVSSFEALYFYLLSRTIRHKKSHVWETGSPEYVPSVETNL